MRTAAVLGVATMLTASVLSGTFAKYTTTAEGTDSARVAKWGFDETNTITLSDLFSTSYKNTNSTETVKSSEDSIAPGTSGHATFGFTYDTKDGSANINAPEVEYTFTVDTAGSKIDNSIKSNPNIKWALDSEEESAWGNWDTLLENIAKLSGDTTTAGNGKTMTKGTKEYKPGELPDKFNATNKTDGKNKNIHTVYWKWDFETTSGEDQPKKQDSTDTEMGNASELTDVTLKITITATQVD